MGLDNTTEKFENLDRARDELMEANEKLNEPLTLIFTLSTGAIAISITFQGEFAGDAPVALGLLTSAWVFLVLSIGGYLWFRFLLRIEDYYRKRAEYDIARRDARSGNAKLTEVWIGLNDVIRGNLDRAGAYRKKRKFFRYLIVITFIIGMALLVCFGAINNHVSNGSSQGNSSFQADGEPALTTNDHEEKGNEQEDTEDGPQSTRPN